jgi:hypothetical protein
LGHTGPVTVSTAALSTAPTRMSHTFRVIIGFKGPHLFEKGWRFACPDQAIFGSSLALQLS